MSELKSRSDLEKAARQGCDYCNHKQYAGTKCKNCGREQPAPVPEAHKQEPVAVMTVLRLKDRIEIGYGPKSAGYDLPTGEYPLYTRPKSMMPLTDEQIEECMKQAYATVQGRNLEHAFARAIEAAHGIKGDA